MASIVSGITDTPALLDPLEQSLTHHARSSFQQRQIASSLHKSTEPARISMVR
jgi:hypothetical protein